MSVFQLAYCSQRGDTEMHHLDGVPWTDAPMPRRLHRCRPQTVGYVNYFTKYERCACGAVRRDGRFWHYKNGRRAK